VAIRNEKTSAEILKFLLDQDLKPTEKNSLGQTVLHAACLNSPAYSDLFKLILDSTKKAFNQFTTERKPNLADSTPSFDSWLNSASFLDSNNESPLHLAAKTNNRALCELLLSFGLDPRLKNVNETLPHDLCTNESLRQTLREAVRLGEAKEELVLSTQALLEACKSGDLDVVKVQTPKTEALNLIPFFE
jgi:ankyrin repeat protein